MKFVDCSACIGLNSINCEIVNHENYYVYERSSRPNTPGI